MEVAEINITDNNIETYEVDHNDEVRSITITDCPLLTTISIDLYSALTTIIIDICPLLESLTIINCHALTTISINTCPMLNDFTISDCPLLTTISPLPPGLIEFNCDETIIDELCKNPDFLLSFINLIDKYEFKTDISFAKQLELVDKLEMFKDTTNASFEVFMHEASNPLLAKLPDAIKANVMSYLNTDNIYTNAERIEWKKFMVDLVKADSKAKIEAKNRLRVGKNLKFGGKRKTKKRSKKRSKRKSKRSRKIQKKRHHSQSRPRNSN